MNQGVQTVLACIIVPGGGHHVGHVGIASHTPCHAYDPFQEQEMEVRKQAFDEERRRREDLEKRLQEETSRRQKLIDREVKLREKQRAQVGRESLCWVVSLGWFVFGLCSSFEGALIEHCVFWIIERILLTPKAD